MSGGIQEGKARLVIEGWLTEPAENRKVIYATSLQDAIHVSREKLQQRTTIQIEVLEGLPREFPLTIQGTPVVRSVKGEGLLDWSIRQGTNDTRMLVLRPRERTAPTLAVTVEADAPVENIDTNIVGLSFTPSHAALLNAHLKITSEPGLQVDPGSAPGLVPIPPDLLPEPLRETNSPAPPLAFRVQGTSYQLPLRLSPADPEALRVKLTNFRLEGLVSSNSAAFTLSATARVQNPQGASIQLLTGGAALSELQESDDWHLKFENGKYVLVVKRPGEFPIQVRFNAAVRHNPADALGWKRVEFQIAGAALAPLTLIGLAPDTQFDFPGAARPERRENAFVTFLPADGAVRLGWKETGLESEGKLFFSAEMLAQMTVSPGIARQTALIEGKVMQGELSRLTLDVTGPGKVTRVQGSQILSWNVTAGGTNNQRLEVLFNQPQKDQFGLQVNIETPLGGFPETIETVRIRPEGVTRFAGFLRVVNDGAVRLEPRPGTGLSQVSPEQFPETDVTRAVLRLPGTQQFVFRFSTSEFALTIQASQILPELSVSEVLVYHLGENELAIEAELDLEIREAPLRELLITVPKGYVLAKVNASGLSDYFIRELGDQGTAELRLVYGQPVSGRQLVELRLERNGALEGAVWELPPLQVEKTKSVRGQVGISADAGYRMVPEKTQGLTEVATAFFPKKIAGLQNAFRLSDPGWSATVRVERLPQTIQADVMHLFSIGEGIAYGSSVINYLISGAPVSALVVQLSDEYFNVEFTGKDVRNWQRSTNGYVVQLHTPVSGPYTLLAAYERPFRPQGETLSFTGARPVQAQSEQGHTLVISAYQFQVTPTEVSPGLLPLETGEVPTEYRLFFDAPLLAAYRYTARPFNLRLALSPLAQGDSLSQVVDRAALTTRISKEGHVITDGRYFVKNRGNPHLAVSLPPGTELWSATVDGVPVVPVKDMNSNLIPLPQRGDANAVLKVEVKAAARSKTASRVTVAAPVMNAPVLLTEWNVLPDTGRRLVFRSGSLAPRGEDPSGFANLVRLFTAGRAEEAWGLLAGSVVFTVIGLIVWGWAVKHGDYRFSPRHIGGLLVGGFAVLLALGCLLALADSAQARAVQVAQEMSFLAPIQQSGTLLEARVANLPEKPGFWSGLVYSWPALLAITAWLYSLTLEPGYWRRTLRVLGWVLAGWAALRWPNGAAYFFVVMGAFLVFGLALRSLRSLLTIPRRPGANPEPGLAAGSAPATAALLIVATLGLDSLMALGGTPIGNATAAAEAPQAQSITHELRVEDRFVFATSRVQWKARKGQTLPLIAEPGVITGASYPSNRVRLVSLGRGGTNAHGVYAQEDGPAEVELRYQVQLGSDNAENGFVIPMRFGLVNQATITLMGLDVEVFSPQAVSVQRERQGSNTVARLVLAPASEVRIGWRPRSRDLTGEKAVFYAELAQLYVPAAGVVEGVHHVAIRPAQGQVSELRFAIPQGATVTDVLTPQPAVENQAAQNAPLTAADISVWRFDPDARLLRVTMNRAQSRPFTVILRSQIATGPLPFKHPAGLVSVLDAAGQLGTVAVATGNEVQLDEVDAGDLASINVEDFPIQAVVPLQSQIAGLTVRRAYRYSSAEQALTLAASPVEPDIRVETQDTLSLGEDRTVLASTMEVAITRAGIFRLSFRLPNGFDVDSISSPVLSHWTEAKAETNGVPDVITLHLKGRTEGRHQLNISLTGSGLKSTNGWEVPKLVLQQATKHTGTLLLVPEQGMRLQPGAREAVTQLDPQRSGVRQKGVLAFRVLQAAWRLTLDIEQVNSWIQVTSLQHATVSEAQLKVTANLQYQIENTGVKALRVLIPTNAEAVRFSGDQVSDFALLPGAVTNSLQTWEIKLHRRVIGAYRLQASYQVLLPENAPEAIVRGTVAGEVNLQRGYLTVQSPGRLQLRAPQNLEALQPTEWQSIPRVLQQDLELTSASYAYRLVEPFFALPLKLERHEAARMLAARVESVLLTSVVSDNGAMLTHARLQIVPGDKRLLKIELPRNARFWFAFVNQNGVWPWREQDRILIPLEQPSTANQPIPVEFFYTAQAGEASRRSLDLALLGPKFDLPLEDITWRVSLSDRWKLDDWSGSLQLEEQAYTPLAAAADLQLYLQNERSELSERTKRAEDLLAFGNSALEQGKPQQARRAFQQAFGLSSHDAAFNEDARVQLHNIKVQQALIGLNVRQAGADPATVERVRDLKSQKDPAYTQQQAREILDRNTLEDNTALARLAERIVQQQDAAVAPINALRASVPEQGRTYVFKRSVLVDTWADLSLALEASSVSPSSAGMRLLILLATGVVLAVLAWASRPLRSPANPAGA